MKIIFLVLFVIIFYMSMPTSYQQDNENKGTSEPWTFDYQFFKEIILIAIPVGTAFFTSRYLTDKWQKNKEKAELKKEIQIEVDESLVHYIMLILNVYRKMFDEYNTVDKDTRYENGKLLNLINSFPTDPVQYPDVKFAEDISKMWKELTLVDEKMAKLKSSLILYYKNEALISQYSRISYSTGPIRLQFKKMIQSKDGKEFDDKTELFMKLVDKYRNDVEEFKKELVNAEIKFGDKKRKESKKSKT